MGTERLDAVYAKEKHSFSADFDALKFVGLYFIATGRIPSKERRSYLKEFVGLSLEQGSGGFDEIADTVAREDPKHSNIVKTYWGTKQVEKYRHLLEAADKKYPKDEARSVKIGMASWYNTFHFHESKVRGIVPPVTEKEEFRSCAENPAVNYRESTNKAYVNAMLEIVDPAITSEKNKENKTLVEKVLYPTSMLYQTVTDFAQRGLTCQRAKPTMDKGLEADVSILPLTQRINVLTYNAINQAHQYAGQIDFPTHLTNKRLRAKFTQGVAWLSYAQEVLKYQVLGSDKERYPQLFPS